MLITLTNIVQWQCFRLWPI